MNKTKQRLKMCHKIIFDMVEQNKVTEEAKAMYNRHKYYEKNGKPFSKND